MPLSFILNRMWRARREMIMLLVALSLVTGFLALGPLYLRVLGESGLRYTIANANPRDLTLSLTSQSPLNRADRPIITHELGAVAAEVEAVTTMNGLICNREARDLCFGDDRADTRLPLAYVPVAYERLSEHFAVVAGAFPTAESQAAITSAVAEQSQLALGDSLTFYPGTPQALTLEIVGILDPIQPADRFWISQTTVTKGQINDVTENLQRLDVGIILTESAYADQIAPIAPSGTRYDWYIETNTDALRAAGLNGLTAALANVERTFRLGDPDLRLIGGLPPLLDQFQADLLAVEGTVILFAIGVLLLLIYQLMTTTALLLERQTIEWSSINSRGGSSAQLIRMQALTMTLLAGLAFLIGIPVAVGIVILVGRFSPLSAIIGEGVTVTTIPPESVVLSAAAALVAIVALTIPAIPAARASVLRLRQSISRPPITPVWARYGLDLVLIALGLLLLLRLYFVFGGASVEALLSDPLALVRLTSANAAQTAGVLNDPFNLAAALFLIAGLALFWLRLFPLIMRGIGALISRANGLVGTLALWNIARDPGHYAQLVLVLICTLAIGTAALALAATHDLGAWNSARTATGGEVRLTFAPEVPAATALPGKAELLLHATTSELPGNKTTDLYGVSAERFTALSGTTPPDRIRAGIVLPADAAAVSVQVYAEPIAAGTVKTRLALDVVNTIGVPRSIPFTTPDETITGAFVTYTASLPDDPHLPFRLTGVRFLSRVGSDGLEHVVYLDDLAYTRANGDRVPLDDFERSAAPEWTSAAPGNVIGSPSPLVAVPSQSHAASGSYALRVQYNIVPVGGRLSEPTLLANASSAQQPIPIIISSEYATTLGRRTLRRPYAVGDVGAIPLALADNSHDLRFRIVAVFPSFPTASDRFLIAPIDDLLPFLNTAAAPDAYYATNVAWLTLPTRELSAAQRAQIEALPGITNVTEAWDQYNRLLHEPLPNAIIVVLFAGFWISLALGLLDFGIYLIITASRRATAFAVLRALGWHRSRIWSLLTVEQAALVLPALVIGVLLGAVLAYLLLPFLALLGSARLQLPLPQIGGLLLALIVGFGALLTGAALTISRVQVSQVLRMDEG